MSGAAYQSIKNEEILDDTAGDENIQDENDGDIESIENESNGGIITQGLETKKFVKLSSAMNKNGFFPEK